MRLSKESSDIINYLKCLLCIGMVYIHTPLNPNELSQLREVKYSYIIGCGDVISNFLDETCVPLFFIISGYLFFVGVEQNFSFTAYKRKIKTRLASVVVPLVVSNAVFLVPKLILANGQMDMMSALSAFWSYNGSGSPINVPTWY